MINEFDNEATRNHLKEKEVMSEVSITTIIRAYDNIDTFVPSLTDPEEIDNAQEMMDKFLKIIRKCETDAMCPKCGGVLYLSDLPQYDYVCPDCDENF